MLRGMLHDLDFVCDMVLKWKLDKIVDTQHEKYCKHLVSH